VLVLEVLEVPVLAQVWGLNLQAAAESLQHRQ
jgi:hypothetical protein